MSVKVAVRVRPFNERELSNAKSSVCCIEMDGPTTTITDPASGTPRPFTFDYSFWSHDDFVDTNGYFSPASDSSKYADQSLVYNTLGTQVLDNAWEGYHCCLFAYGQTGSGKSYSMIGYNKNEGIIPMACNEIFNRIHQQNKGSFEVQFSMLEIYNEKIQDLLVSNQNQTSLKVREQKKGEIYVQGLSKHPVDSYDAIAAKMDEGYTNRSIGATLMNQTSSRAHTIITIEFKQVRVEGGRKLEKLSVINLVDLAGSEKAGQTGAEGQRLKEGCAINKSLTVLGNCISVLADKATGKQKNAVVPYRDSNLTRILQNALGGNSKTIMICAVSPAALNYEESLGTLRYADRAKKIMNVAVINESVQDKMIRDLKSENDKLKEILMKAALSGGSIDLKALGLEGQFQSEGDGPNDQKDLAEKMAQQLAETEKQIEEMEKTWEQKLKEQRQKDELEKQKQIEQKQKSDKRAPHLTNLNEDIQLSGKLYYSLREETTHIGRHDGDPTPQIILMGVGIQRNHAQIKLIDNGNFEIHVYDKECWEQTFVNGKKLIKRENHFYTQLFHLDRIFIGVNTLFLFKYPLQNLLFSDLYENLKQGNEISSEQEKELKIMARQQMDSIGMITSDLSNLVCHEYTDSQIEQDCHSIDYDTAYQEAHQLEDILKRQQIEQQLLEKQQIEEEYKNQIQSIKKQEEMKIQKLQIEQLAWEHKLQQQILKAQKESSQKVDKAEVQKLQDQLNQVQEQIKRENELKIQQQLSQKSLLNSQSIKEANELCKLMGQKIKFKQCVIQKIDSSSDGDDEELQIRVHNYDKNTVEMLTVKQFEEKLQMMRNEQMEQKKEEAAKIPVRRGFVINSNDNKQKKDFMKSIAGSPNPLEWLQPDPYAAAMAKIAAEKKAAADAKYGKKEVTDFLDAATNKFDIEVLKKGIPEGVDPKAKETYLSDEQFQTVFGMTPDAFNALKDWKKKDIKKAKGLF